MITKFELDELVRKYETVDFIKDDPIQFCHKYTIKEEIELAGFISSLFAYGNRKIFINKLEELFSYTDNDLLGFIKYGNFDCLKNFEYRFSKANDIIPILQILSKLYNESNGLSELFTYAKNYSSEENPKNQINLQVIVDYFYSFAPKSAGQGFYHMIPNPQNGGAMKRMNMFLRWMVRKGPVDLGIWSFIDTKDLLIPLDVHVSRVSRNMGLLNRKSNDFKSVLELTNKLKEFCSVDPVKYDFAMFGFGVQ